MCATKSWRSDGPVRACRNPTRSGGSYPPNAYGPYDMAGNVWGYLLDEWRDDYADRKG
ncbi:MAG: SUMF1/EgtB/PvdO family nonheme iron enzyme [Rhodothermales bacterium]|nr:SUMF1/EgtB/PvdO family nonheme iron enzyme [Rhodothermales bacterium]